MLHSSLLVRALALGSCRFSPTHDGEDCGSPFFVDKSLLSGWHDLGGCFEKLALLSLDVLVARALLFWVSTRARDVWKLPGCLSAGSERERVRHTYPLGSGNSLGARFSRVVAFLVEPSRTAEMGQLAELISTMHDVLSASFCCVRRPIHQETVGPSSVCRYI